MLIFDPHAVALVEDGTSDLVGPFSPPPGICVVCEKEPAAPLREVCHAHDKCGICGTAPTLDGNHCEPCQNSICRDCNEPRCTDGETICDSCEEGRYEAACDAAYDAWKEDGGPMRTPRRNRR